MVISVTKNKDIALAAKPNIARSSSGLRPKASESGRSLDGSIGNPKEISNSREGW